MTGMQPSGTSVSSFFLSVLLHLGAVALLVISIDMSTRTFRPSHPEIVQAVTVDSKEVEKELQKLRDLEDQKLKKQQEAEKKLKEAEQKLATAEQQRKREEVQLAETKKKQEQEKLKHEQEQQKLAQIKQQQEEAKKKQQAEETERKRKEEETAKQKQLAEETERKRKEQAQQDQQLLNSIYSAIQSRVKNNFNISGLPPGLKCVILVRVIPGGEIINSSINRSSGNEIFDSRALVAVQKTSPLPVPQDAATLDRLRLRNFEFEFSP